jgi:hypothetical protein
MKTTFTNWSSVPPAPRGSVVVTSDGTEFVVEGHTATTLALRPRQWWHKVPWLWLLGGLIGAIVGQILWHWA